MKIDMPVSAPPRVTTADDTTLRAAAQELEAAFLAEMLKPMGAAKTREAFGGGIGEEQFGTLLLQQEARVIVKDGGIGLAQSIFEALKMKAGLRDE